MTEAGSAAGPGADEERDLLGGRWLTGDTPYGAMIDRLRDFLDHVAAAKLDDATAQALDADLAAWTQRLTPMVADEAHRMFGRVRDAPGHGQVFAPAFIPDQMGDDSLHARVTFGAFHLGANYAAHGGAVALLFDEILGLPANMSAQRMARTAYLHVNYRAITPIDKELQVSAWVTKVEGRKRFVRGELRYGDLLCADAEGLFIELLPHQQ
ncbi:MULTISPECIES: PaaI family thioesterase [Sphingobium]|uniref:Acyl-coenzyme A thioesterase THEM4 n=1 Tax=Sphingobium yanoikuyae ATCC 51230 TaxID=883163 RepID=K9D3M8_SPHYA|nr:MULTISPECIES: PaaI family thioesterase [Sphingobium]EKU73587.1 hypothetical protein HMPREF9718_04056 [Sphingobium yanoikuyae ATCC 51230]WQE08361.1 PaaI family thioesterase [Sphingobium yanoikuyae]SHM09256.1 Acyl-coenzyme A thioesterase PaaI, contains HGG motif [Sphingobium sp. YR657]